MATDSNTGSSDRTDCQGAANIPRDPIRNAAEGLTAFGGRNIEGKARATSVVGGAQTTTEHSTLDGCDTLSSSDSSWDAFG